MLGALLEALYFVHLIFINTGGVIYEQLLVTQNLE
jgi:hypothetical protein